MRAIVHSIHSQVPATIRSLAGGCDRVLSLDSHLDVSLGGDYEVYPSRLRPIAERTGAHSAICEVLEAGKTQPARRGARVIVAIPRVMLLKHASDIEARLPQALRAGGTEESVSLVEAFLSASQGIEVYDSPPNPLSGLRRRVTGARRWVLDVDVDCMTEMQRECYTQIRGAARGTLQSMREVVDFIRSTKPETVTVSEAKVSAIRSNTSRFSEFMRSLGALGYSIEERGLYASDQEVSRGIEVCKEFYDKVSTPLLNRHLYSMMRGDYSGFEREEQKAAARFFAREGYGA